MATLAPSLRDLRAQLNSIAPNRSKVADGWIGDAAHAARNSRHNPNAQGVVCALDITHDPTGGMDNWWLREALRASRDDRIGVVISMGQIFSSTATSARPAWTWGRYTGANRHDHHLHVDVHAGGTRAGFWNLSRDLGAPVRPPTEMPRPSPVEDDMPHTEAELRKYINEEVTKVLTASGTAGAAQYAQRFDPEEVKQLAEELVKVSVTQGYAGAGDLGRLTTALAPLLGGGGDVAAAAAALRESLPAAVAHELAERLKS